MIRRNIYHTVQKLVKTTFVNVLNELIHGDHLAESLVKGKLLNKSSPRDL